MSEIHHDEIQELKEMAEYFEDLVFTLKSRFDVLDRERASLKQQLFKTKAELDVTQQAKELLWKIRYACAGVSFEDERVSYVEVKIPKDAKAIDLPDEASEQRDKRNDEERFFVPRMYRKLLLHSSPGPSSKEKGEEEEELKSRRGIIIYRGQSYCLKEEER